MQKGWGLRGDGNWWVTTCFYGTVWIQGRANPPKSVKVFTTRKAARYLAASRLRRWIPVKLIRDGEGHDWEVA